MAHSGGMPLEMLKKREERKREVTVTLFEKRGHTRGIFLSGNG
jgi:hypothetical protein